MAGFPGTSGSAQKSMGGCQCCLLLLLLSVMVLALLARGTVATGNSDQDPSIQVRRNGSSVFLHCSADQSDPELSWSKDGRMIDGAKATELPVGLAADDPRGLYRCHSKKGDASLQLYFRMCQYCIQLNVTTVLGMVAANVVVTAFLVGAVWCLAAQEPGRLPRALDKQALLAHDQLYQPLGERNNGQHSLIGVAKARRR